MARLFLGDAFWKGDAKETAHLSGLFIIKPPHTHTPRRILVSPQRPGAGYNGLGAEAADLLRA